MEDHPRDCSQAGTRRPLQVHGGSMRLRRLVRSRSHDLRDFRKEWIEAGLPQYPTNAFLKGYLQRLKESRWLPAEPVKARARSMSRVLRTWGSFLKGALSRLLGRSPSARTAVVLALFAASSILLTSGCATKTRVPSVGPCVDTECGVCCNDDGKLCCTAREFDDGRGVPESGGDPEGGLP